MGPNETLFLLHLPPPVPKLISATLLPWGLAMGGVGMGSDDSGIETSGVGSVERRVLEDRLLRLGGIGVGSFSVD